MFLDFLLRHLKIFVTSCADIKFNLNCTFRTTLRHSFYKKLLTGLRVQVTQVLMACHTEIFKSGQRD